MAPSAYTGAVLDITSGKWWVRGGLANVNTRARHVGQQAAGADLPRRLFQGRVQRLRLQRRARQGGQLRRQRRHLSGRHRRGRRRRQPDLRGHALRRRRQEHHHQPVRGRRLLHPRRLVVLRPGQLWPAEGRGHLQQRRRAARRQLVGSVGHGGLQDHAAPGRRAARRLRGQHQERRRPARLQLRRPHQRHRPRPARRRQLRQGRVGGRQPLCHQPGHELPVRREARSSSSNTATTAPTSRCSNS